MVVAQQRGIGKKIDIGTTTTINIVRVGYQASEVVNDTRRRVIMEPKIILEETII